MPALWSESPLSVVPQPRPVPAMGPGVRPVPAMTAGAKHARPLGLYDSWWTLGGAAMAICAVWAASVWISVHLQADATLHTVALFVHLASLVLGFGAVLVADYFGLLWITGRCSLRDALGSAGRLHFPIWAGLAGLVASGTMLHPNPSSTLTCVKLVMVLVLSLNGLQAGLLNKRMAQHGSTDPAPRFLAWGGATALVSQICWWGAVIIGFLNTQS
ncbi:hypothetical protein AB0F13_25845 [Streptomyces sp. NPDC026206]|uniref:hypothetical protein n=1 Tax=Streptomyces sp. NPDC026206 TaxID=3157089 RepID=UPI0033DDA36D